MKLPSRIGGAAHSCQTPPAQRPHPGDGGSTDARTPLLVESVSYLRRARGRPVRPPARTDLSEHRLPILGGCYRYHAGEFAPCASLRSS